MRDKPTFENRRNTRTTTSLAEYMHLGSSGPVAMVRRGCKAEAQLEKLIGIRLPSPGEGKRQIRTLQPLIPWRYRVFGVIVPCTLFEENGALHQYSRLQREKETIGYGIRKFAIPRRRIRSRRSRRKRLVGGCWCRLSLSTPY